MHILIQNKFGERLDYSFSPGKVEYRREGWVAILGHGLTGNKDRPIVSHSAAALNQIGVDTVRVSFSGNGESEGDFAEATISKEAADLSCVIDTVSKSYSKIIYVGHSMGSAVGIVQVIRDPRIHLFVSLAGMLDTRLFAETEFQGVTPDQGVMWEEPECPLSSAFMKDLCETHSNLVDRYKGVGIPWLLIHGTEDDVVLPRDSERVDLENASSVKIEGADHVFSKEQHMKVVTGQLCSWISQKID